MENPMEHQIPERNNNAEEGGMDNCELEEDFDPAMLLSREEMDRALQIKEAAQEQGATLKELSDFEYATYAICCAEESMDQIMNRMEMMQAFKTEYRIQDTPEEGVEVFSQLTQEHPGFCLSIAYVESSKNYLHVIDWSCLFPAKIKTPEQIRNYMAYLYYSQPCKQCQFQCTRTGTSMLVECKDATMENFDSEFFSKMQHELLRYYPKIQKGVFLLNSPSVANMAFALWRKFMSPNQKQSIYLGHQLEGLEGQSIAELYNTPTPEMAREHLLLSCKIFLEHRYKNEREFRLPQETLDEEIIY